MHMKIHVYLRNQKNRWCMYLYYIYRYIYIYLKPKIAQQKTGHVANTPQLGV